MDNQPLMPSGSGPFSSLPGSGMPSGLSAGLPGGGSPRRSPILPILLILFALGTFGFGTLTLVFAQKSSSTAKSADARVAAAVKAAQEKQKADDETAAALINGSPFRAYAAPVIYGSFVIAFPKNWSSWVEESTSGKMVELVVNPDFIRRTKGTNDPAAARIIYQGGSKDTYIRQFASNIKNGSMKQGDITVSGQAAIDFTGTFSDKTTVRMVVIPIRDKVLIFSCENAKYASEFNQILAQSKVVP